MDDVKPLTVDREQAREMYLKYLSHRNNQGPYDADIARIYREIASGKVIVQAITSIIRAGLGADNLPKLAICRADAKKTFLSARHNGAVTMIDDARWVDGRTAKSRYFEFPAGSFPGINLNGQPSAIVPHIPPDIRPRRGIQNYHILWEATWRFEAPIDPLLLRRLPGGGDLWVVCGAWDLTDIERAVMMEHAGRRNNA